MRILPNLGAVQPYKTIMGNFLPSLLDFYRNPADYALEPFRIYGNLYYVGDKKVCSHLIDTGDGLILFDTGYQHTAHLLVDSIYKLGFRPEDIKIIIHSHGHFDHFGAGNDFRKLYGCRIYMSKTETELLRQEPRRALMHLNPCPHASICWPDHEIEDNEVITLGNTSIRCVPAPGHTHGTMAFFFPVTQDGVTLTAGYWGGAGFLTVYKDYCKEYDLPQDLCEQMKDTIGRLDREQVDICLGNHPGQNCNTERRAQMLQDPSHNPFIDSAYWHDFLAIQERKRKDFEALGY